MTRGRKACLGGQPCEPANWKEVLYCLVQHSKREPAEIAARINKRVGYLLDASNPDRDDASFRVDLLDQVIEAADNLAPVRYLCGRFHGVFVPLPSAAASDDQILSAFTRAVAEVGQSGDALTRGLEDDKITLAEAQRACQQIDETVAAFMAVKALVCSRIGGAR